MGMSQSVMSLARIHSPFISGVIMEVSVSETALFGSFASSVAVIIMIFRSQEPKIYSEKNVQYIFLIYINFNKIREIYLFSL